MNASSKIVHATEAIQDTSLPPPLRQDILALRKFLMSLKLCSFELESKDIVAIIRAIAIMHATNVKLQSRRIIDKTMFQNILLVVYDQLNVGKLVRKVAHKFSKFPNPKNLPEVINKTKCKLIRSNLINLKMNPICADILNSYIHKKLVMTKEELMFAKECPNHVTVQQYLDSQNLESKKFSRPEHTIDYDDDNDRWTMLLREPVCLFNANINSAATNDQSTRKSYTNNAEDEIIIIADDDDNFTANTVNNDDSIHSDCGDIGSILSNKETFNYPSCDYEEEDDNFNCYYSSEEDEIIVIDDDDDDDNVSMQHVSTDHASSAHSSSEHVSTEYPRLPNSQHPKNRHTEWGSMKSNNMKTFNTKTRQNDDINNSNVDCNNFAEDELLGNQNTSQAASRKRPYYNEADSTTTTTTATTNRRKQSTSCNKKSKYCHSSDNSTDESNTNNSTNDDQQHIADNTNSTSGMVDGTTKHRYHVDGNHEEVYDETDEETDDGYSDEEEVEVVQSEQSDSNAVNKSESLLSADDNAIDGEIFTVQWQQFENNNFGNINNTGSTATRAIRNTEPDAQRIDMGLLEQEKDQLISEFYQLSHVKSLDMNSCECLKLSSELFCKIQSLIYKYSHLHEFVKDLMVVIKDIMIFNMVKRQQLNYRYHLYYNDCVKFLTDMKTDESPDCSNQFKIIKNMMKENFDKHIK